MSTEMQLQKELSSYFASLNKSPEPDEDLFKSGVLDSMGMLDLLTHMEENMGIELSQNMMQMEKLSSINKIVATLT